MPAIHPTPSHDVGFLAWFCKFTGDRLTRKGHIPVISRRASKNRYATIYELSSELLERHPHKGCIDVYQDEIAVESKVSAGTSV